jgi:hypothetical protein
MVSQRIEAILCFTFTTGILLLGGVAVVYIPALTH